MYTVKEHCQTKPIFHIYFLKILQGPSAHLCNFILDFSSINVDQPFIESHKIL